jgi:hypothetical protein
MVQYSLRLMFDVTDANDSVTIVKFSATAFQVLEPTRWVPPVVQWRLRR